MINNPVNRATSEATNRLRNRASDAVLQPRGISDAIIKSTTPIDRDCDADRRRGVGQRDRCGDERECCKNECSGEVHIGQGVEGWLLSVPKRLETLRDIRGVLEVLYS